MQKIAYIFVFLTSLHFLPMPCVGLEAEQDFDALVTAQRQTLEAPALLSSKLYVAEKRFELALQMAYVPNDDFYNYFPIQFRLGYHFNDLWGLELQSTLLLLKSKTNLSTFLESRSSAQLDLEQISDRQLARFNLVAVFHPLYGKWSFNRVGLGHFDWGVYAGAGLVVVSEPSSGKLRKSARFDAVLGSQFHFFILPYLALRADFAVNIYPSFNGVLAPCSIGLGLSYYTPTVP
ncbi:MAG: outer membrane beta-barrel domain-containing protein [Bradymonadales bacterium]|jgi:outer membrane beta-barrel protein